MYAPRADLLPMMPSLACLQNTSDSHGGTPARRYSPARTRGNSMRAGSTLPGGGYAGYGPPPFYLRLNLYIDLCFYLYIYLQHQEPTHRTGIQDRRCSLRVTLADWFPFLGAPRAPWPVQVFPAADTGQYWFFLASGIWPVLVFLSVFPFSVLIMGSTGFS